MARSGKREARERALIAASLEPVAVRIERESSEVSCSCRDGGSHGGRGERLWRRPVGFYRAA